MPNVEHVASYLLSVSKPGTPRSITPLKLQKLLYYCQGWHMAFNQGEPLFNEELEAWEHGPVNRDIYIKYKNHRYLTIPIEPFINKTRKGKPIFKQKQLDILNTVWETYGQFDGKYLEELTHQEDPWLETKRNTVIDKNKLFRFFTRLAQKDS
ncbi:type II toxin-antitoxin system antitoxin SocA domain-containing protein [Cytobacillus firmus]|uniref:Putative prophage protein Ps3 n=1 Tax=Cytobacillus firmus TaxID=1399 RepID=A0A800MSD1_CYTFI|nr:type II toxin-antitoxin system antitoxin SocA domain-containing protein [Cytobacillus firmus]KAF0821511.1 putative prophage protein Ps3 [Cytobacillus firmus]